MSGVNFGPKHFWGEQLQVFVHLAGLCGQGKFKHVFTQSQESDEEPFPIPQAQESEEMVPSTKLPPPEMVIILVREFIFPEFNDDNSAFGEFFRVVTSIGGNPPLFLFNIRSISHHNHSQ